MTITQSKMEELAAYYDHTDLSDSIERAERNDEPAVSPMVTTSLRLPVELMEAIRVQAAAQGVRPTALMRRWVEEAATGQTEAVAKAVRELRGVALDIRNSLNAVGQSTPRRGSAGARAKKAPPRTATAKAVAPKTGTRKAAPNFTTTKVAAKKASTQTVSAKKATPKKDRTPT